MSKENIKIEKPTPEKYGWHTKSGFADEPSGWIYEGCEEAYYAALKEWEEKQGKGLAGILKKEAKTMEGRNITLKLDKEELDAIIAMCEENASLLGGSGDADGYNPFLENAKRVVIINRMLEYNRRKERITY